MSRNRVKAVLKTAKNLIDTQERWVKGALFTNRNHEIVQIDDAECYCLSGAILAAAASDEELAQQAIDAVSATLGNRSVVSFNDATSTTLDDVQNLLDRTLERV